MSVAVDLDNLRTAIAARSRPAFVVTAGDRGGPHLVATFLRWVDGALECGAGKTTVRNLVQRREATLVFPADEVDGYTLIVDVDGEVLDGEAGATARFSPTHAILHRPGTGLDGPDRHDCADIG